MEYDSELVPVKFDKVMQSKAFTCVVLGTDTKKFAIYTDPASGKAMQMYLAETEKPRPYTHDLLNMIFKAMEVKIRQIIINDLQDTIYFARLYLEQQMGELLHIIEIDARPSDCITLALVNKTPVYVTSDVLEKVVPVEEE